MPLPITVKAFSRRHGLLRGASLLVVGLVSLPAFAQSIAGPDAEQGDAIVVSGYQLQNQLSVGEKRSRDYEAEFLSNDETGQQPDFNVSDSLRRLPGVDTIFDEDEGRYVAIRGLDPDYTFGSLDGAALASSERNNRRLNMEAIPTIAIRRSEVRKSRTPEMEGSAIGGAIDLTTRSAYDSKGVFLAGNAYIGHYDSTSIPIYGDTKGFWGNNKAPGTNGISMRGGVTFASKFGSDDQFGVVMAGSFLRRQRDQVRYQPGAWTQRGDDLVPAQAGMIGYPLSSERWSLMGKLEYKPSSDFYASVMLSHFEQNEREYRYNGVYYMRGTPTTDGEGNYTHSQGQMVQTFNDYASDKPLTVLNGNIKWTPSDVSVIEARASWSEAKFFEPSMGVRFQTANNNSNLGGTVNIKDYIPTITIANPEYFADPANYSYNFFQATKDDNVDTVKEAELNYGWNVGRGDQGFGFRLGTKFRNTDRKFDYTRYDHARVGDAITMEDFFSGTYDIHNVNASIPAMDIEKFWNWVEANPDRLRQTENANTTLNDYRMIEDVWAAYATGSLRGDAYSVIFGLRMEDTSTHLERPSTVDGVTNFVTRKGGYTNFLPSITGWYELADGLRVRGSYYKGVGRPNPNQLAAGERLSIGEDGEVNVVTRGNPDLKARTADNFSASIEYYFPENGGIISASLFRKNVRNDIFTGRTEGIFEGEEVIFSQPRNMSDAHVTGAEFNLVRNSLDFLPGALKGFGISTNLTLMRGESNVIMDDGSERVLDYMREQPRALFNASLFYKSGPWQIRGTYANKSKYLKTINLASSSGDDLDRYERNYEQFDLQLRFRANDHLELVAEARNLTNSYRNDYQDLEDMGLRDYNYTGRAFWLGASLKL